MKPRFFKSPAEFRRWLDRNHDKKDDLIVGYYKVKTGKPSMTWSQSVDEARTRLMERFELSDVQARAILDMRLARLTGLEIEKLEAEYAEVKEKIAYYNTILSDRTVLIGLIKDDVEELRDAALTLAETNFEELTDEEFVALSESLEGLESAQMNAEAWVRENCDTIPADFFE